MGNVSRTRLYSSVSEMAKDSAIVVVGTVLSDSVTADIDPVTEFTLASVRVDKVVDQNQRSPIGANVVVRQAGSPTQMSQIPLLKTGKQYLLFLTASGLDGEQAEQFYVTGANAGIYENRSGGDAFAQVQRQVGEDLPMTISERDVVG